MRSCISLLELIKIIFVKEVLSDGFQFGVHMSVFFRWEGQFSFLYVDFRFFLQGVTEVLKPGESATEIKRVLLHPDTSRRMVEPDFNVKRPDGCNDSLILYVTTEQTDYEPLTQGPIDLSPHLSTRTLDSTDVCINKQFP